MELIHDRGREIARPVSLHVRAVMEVGFIFRPSQQMKVVLSDSSNVSRKQKEI